MRFTYCAAVSFQRVMVNGKFKFHTAGRPRSMKPAPVREYIPRGVVNAGAPRVAETVRLTCGWCHP